MKYVYPAIFYAAVEGGYTVEFPDVEGALTQGETLLEALEMAEESLSMAMAMFEDNKSNKLNPPFNNRIVEPTPIQEVVVEPDEYSTSAFVTLIKADTDAYRKQLAEMQEKESVEKNARGAA